MLCASVVYGMSISSYTHRRRSVDIYQTSFIIVAIFVVCGLGAALGSDLSFFMLALVPDTLLLGILCSTFFHFGLRQCGRTAGVHQRKIRNPDEKQVLLP
jgi:uncharacterized membrane protein YfcA